MPPEALLEDCETRLGVRFPDDYRHWVLNGPGIGPRPRAYLDHDVMRLREAPWSLGWPPRHEDDGRLFWWVDYNEASSEPEWRSINEWIPKLVPVMDCGDGHDIVYFDFAFDSLQPPIIYVSGESSWHDTGALGRCKFVAGSLTEYLQLPVCPSSDYWPNEHLEALAVPEPSERGMAWNEHRDAILAACF